MMKLYGALVLFLICSAAWGLRCYSCLGADPGSCTNIKTCPELQDRCFSMEVLNKATKDCIMSQGCIGPVSCCEGDLCNGAVPTGPGVILLLLSSAIALFFI